MANVVLLAFHTAVAPVNLTLKAQLGYWGYWGRATLTCWLFSPNVPEMGIVKVYVFGFDLQKSLMGSGALPQLVSFNAFYDIAPDARRALQPVAW